ncbi:hypothetical protein DCC39_04485 [Pueribacillus theae]|uniref:EAL domain-containing protein n=1 Tax=Pueribacillus theae TaxID=2171751 RepID=A0A2U1K738_9BACI|nr:EAL domain-containing protein [Pueribacillus theae]PWA12698.1 hypothetical protein DCC39_04485 [Pueribacillus theae]
MFGAKDKVLEDIIREKNFYHVFQPLYDLENWEVLGYEALLRCKFFSNPEELFQLVKEKNRLFELDRLSILRALALLDNFGYTTLFLNVYPSTLVHPHFPGLLEKQVDRFLLNHTIVFEINEAEHIPDMGLLRRTLHLLKEKGYAIALDDFGKGESSMRSVMQLELDFVKLDRYFSTNLSGSMEKQNMIQHLLEICQQKKMLLILEGIEEPIDLAVAKVLGVHLGQGYLLKKPTSIVDLIRGRG